MEIGYRWASRFGNDWGFLLSGAKMMKNQVRTWVLSAVVGAFVCCGCATKETKTAADVAMSVAPWEAGTANPLLSYVPEDAPVIVATNRSHTMENEGVRNMLWLLGEALELGSDLSPLLSDYRENAAEWGLDPEGKVDAVSYIYDSKMIVHITVADALTAMASFDSFMQIVNEEVKVTMRDVDGWRVYRHEADKVLENNSNMAVHVKGSVMSVVIWNGNGDVPGEILKVVGKPFRAETGKDDVVTGHVDFARLGEFVAKMDWMTDALNERYFDDFMTKKDHERWMSFCRENAKLCVEQYQGRAYAIIPNDAHEAAMSALGDVEIDSANIKELTIDEWISKIGTTNFKDKVCINEFKSVFKDVPSADIAISVSDGGKIGGRIGAKIVAGDFRNELNSLITDHALLKDDSSKTYGYIGYKIYDALKMNEKYLDNFVKKEWKCEQMRGMFDAISENNYSSKKMMRKLGEFSIVLEKFESLSFMLSDFVIAGMGGMGTLPEFLVHMRNAPEALAMILGYFDVPAEEGKVSTIDAGDLQPKVLLSGNGLLVGSSKYDLLSQDVKMAKQRFAEVHVSKNIVQAILPYGKLGGASTSFITDYDLNLSLENEGIVFAVAPSE